MKGEHKLNMLCELLGVSRSGYYRWQTARPTRRQRDDAALAAQIARSHRQSRGNYGSPRIVADLREAGAPISRRRCARLMRAIGVAGKKKHRRKPRTTDSRHGRAVAPNLARLTEAPRAPDQLWVTDITYLQTGQGWLYLAAILDGWSRRVIGWACAPTLAAPLVIAALRSAVKQRRPAAGTIHHSDRGSQYTDAELLNLIDTAGLARSMSRAGNCYDNAMIESFWSTLKTETGLDVLIPATRREAELAVFDYIETFYNPQRRHSSLGQISPVAFELKHQKSHINAA